MREDPAKCLGITLPFTKLPQDSAEKTLASVMLDKFSMKPARKQSADAFTLIELLLVVSVILILAAIILSSLSRQGPVGGQRINCSNNLKQIGLSFRTWALDNGDKFPMQVSVTNGGAMETGSTGAVFTVFQVMSNELSTPKLLICPEENDPKRISASTFQTSVPVGVRNAIPFSNDNNLSYFVNLDAQDTFPGGLLCGDRNLALNAVPVPHGVLQNWTNSTVTWFKPRHNNGGNIGLADGSVQQIGSPRLSSFLIQTGMVTNRLAIP